MIQKICIQRNALCLMYQHSSSRHKFGKSGGGLKIQRLEYLENIFFLGNKKNSYYVPHMTHFEKLSLCSGGNLSANLSHLIIFFPLKSSENLWLSVGFRGNTISLVPLNCLSIRSKIWKRFLICNLTQIRFKEINFFFCIII